MKRLFKIYQAGCLGGVCAGIAYTFKLPTWLLRIIFLYFAIVCPGYTWLTYIILAIVLPSYNGIPEDYYEVCE